MSTLAQGLAEPSGAVLVGADLVVVESAAHRLVRPVPSTALVRQAPGRLQREVTELAPGPVTLTVVFTPPPGRKLDDRFGPSTLLTVAATPGALLGGGDGSGDRSSPARCTCAEAGDGVLAVTAQAASCDDDPAAEHPACYLARQDWGIPVRVTAGGARELRLMLLG